MLCEHEVADTQEKKTMAMQFGVAPVLDKSGRRSPAPLTWPVGWWNLVAIAGLQQVGNCTSYLLLARLASGQGFTWFHARAGDAVVHNPSSPQLDTKQGEPWEGWGVALWWRLVSKFMFFPASQHCKYMSACNHHRPWSKADFTFGKQTLLSRPRSLALRLPRPHLCWPVRVISTSGSQRPRVVLTYSLALTSWKGKENQFRNVCSACGLGCILLYT